MVDKGSKGGKEEVVTREYTIKLHKRLHKEDRVSDATCGNGYDTLAMVKRVADESARGCVYAIDIRNDALENTFSLLEDSLNPHSKYVQIEPVKKLLSRCLSKMGKVVPEASVRLVAFNLGYLLADDKKIITKPDITLLAREAAKGILMSGGLISLVVYVGHPVNSWICCKFQLLNPPWAPILVCLLRRWCH
ncbi:hypothetical protein RGQ29_018560 [Quercus rubra]|uniref:rRNA methylase YtqB n=1 Tax=Quercus rubra TaxID=3512 RepID=A0AAN7FP31_QUERU|nr:hypothetical protein RGQ29_018560 [Quercus rubra]